VPGPIASTRCQFAWSVSFPRLWRTREGSPWSATVDSEGRTPWQYARPAQVSGMPATSRRLWRWRTRAGERLRRPGGPNVGRLEPSHDFQRAFLIDCETDEDATGVEERPVAPVRLNGHGLSLLGVGQPGATAPSTPTRVMGVSPCSVMKPALWRGRRWRG